jgi:XTP/dITP diphosphohydrolase
LTRRHRLTFVTGNKGKVAELAALAAPHGIEVVQDARGYPEVQASSLAQVTEAGADHLLRSGLEPPFLLEDSGLFVDSLRGFPGVYSRHALETIGIRGILRLLDGPGPRGARFESDLLLVEAGARHHFHGTCAGTIATEARGEGGFGYDPVFIPAGEARTFAQMPMAEKARLGHRGKAVGLLLAYLSESAKP